MCEMNSERRLFNLTGQVGTLQWKLDNMDIKKTCHSVRIIRMSVFQQTVTDTMLYRY